MLRAVALIIALIAAPAFAQGPARGPAERDLLVDLAQVLGEAHALRQLCEGPQDQFWRERMAGLIEAEEPDEAFAERLRRTFNAGYARRQNQYPACIGAARRAEREVTATGQAIATELANRSR